MLLYTTLCRPLNCRPLNCHSLSFRPLKLRLFLSLREAQSCSDYLDYCRGNQVLVDSATFRGTLYEFFTKEKLESIMSCRDMARVGGAGDNGVDLIGKWNLGDYEIDEKAKTSSKLILLKTKCNGSAQAPTNLEHDIIALVQCKNYASRIKASTIRELAGIYEYHVRTKMDAMRVFFFLVSPYPLTKQAQAQMDTSKVPIIHMKLLPMELENTENIEDMYHIKHWRSGSFKTVYMNKIASKLLTGVDARKKLLTH